MFFLITESIQNKIINNNNNNNNNNNKVRFSQRVNPTMD